MKLLKITGVVAPYFPGDVGAFEDARAEVLIRTGFAEFIRDLPDDAATDDQAGVDDVVDTATGGRARKLRSGQAMTEAPAPPADV